MERTITRRNCPQHLVNSLFVLCISVYVVGLFGRLSYASVMAKLITSEGFSLTQAGLVGTLMFIAYGVCQFISGIISDKFPARTLVFIGVMASGILNLLMGFMRTIEPMLIIWTINGIFQAFIWTPISRILSESIPPNRRKRVLGNIGLAYPTATILTYIMAALLLHFSHWSTVFFVSGGLMVLISIFWFNKITYFENMTKNHGEIETIVLSSQKANVAGSLWRVLLVSGALFASFGSLVGGMLRDGIQSWMPTYVSECFGISVTVSVALAIALPLCNIFGVLIIRYLYEYYIKNEMRGAAYFFIGGIISLSLLLVASNFGMVVAAIVFMTITSTLMLGVGNMFVSYMPMYFGQVGKTASATGVLNSSAFLGSAISSYGIGKITEMYGWNASIIFWLVSCIISLVVVWFGAKKWEFFIHEL